MADSQSLKSLLNSLQGQAQGVHELIQDEQIQKKKRWEVEEKGSLEKKVSQLVGQQELLRKERKKIKNTLRTNLATASQKQAANVKAIAERYKKEHPNSSDVMDLQTKLIQLSNRLNDIDADIKFVNQELAFCRKEEERELHSTRLVVMQDTQRILQSEIDTLRSNILHIDTSSRLEAEKRSAEVTGFAQLSRIEEQMSKIGSRIDAAKQLIYFPSVKKFQFSTGDSGVFVAANDLFISEISGRFEFSLRRVTKPDGQNATRLWISLAGVSGSAESAEARAAAKQANVGNQGSSPGSSSQQDMSARQARGSTPLAPSASSGPSPSDTAAAPPHPGLPRSTSIQSSRASSGAVDGRGDDDAAGSLGDSDALPFARASEDSRTEASSSRPRQDSILESRTQDDVSFSTRAGGAPGRAPPQQAPQMAVPGLDRPPLSINKTRQHPKGETVAGFLSNLTKQKNALKKKLGPSNRGLDEPPSPASKSSKSSFGDRLKDLPDAMLGKKSKLSKLAKVIANKAPAPHKAPSMRSGSAEDFRRRSSELSQETSDMPSMFRGMHKLRFDDDASETNQMSREESWNLENDSSRHSGSNFGSLVDTSEDAVARQASSKLGSSAATGTPSKAGPFPSKPSPAKQDGFDAQEDMDNDMSIAFQEFEQQPARQGVCCQVLVEHLELIGEKGTKVPDLTIKELMLETEIIVTLLFEWTPKDGWKEVQPLTLNIIELEHKMKGNSMSLPPKALKSILNLVLPGYLTKALLAVLPPEIGYYMMESNEDIELKGEFRLMGQSLATYMADLVPKMATSDSFLDKKIQKHRQQAASRARGLLGLSDQQAQVIKDLFSSLGTSSSLNANIGVPVGGLSIGQLCRFFLTCSPSRHWKQLCSTWDKALQVLFEGYRVPERQRFSFSEFMDTRVMRLLRKPVRVTFCLDYLKVYGGR